MSSKLILYHQHKKYVEIFKNKEKSKIYQSYYNDGMFKLDDDKTLLIMSDIHSATTRVINDLIKKKIINKNTIVLTTGDMAGDGKMGGYGDPYNDYVNILENSYRFYFVQGNHDIKNDKCYNLVNDDGTKCMLDNIIENTCIGKIGGVNGIGTLPKRVDHNKHKYMYDDYYKKINDITSEKLDILLTHQPINKKTFKYTIPLLHICGHAPIEPYIQCDEDYTMINLDGRIFHISPIPNK